MSATLTPVTDAAIARAADILRGGGLVAVPTETVYGLAADAGNPAAIAHLYEVKGRPRFNPLIAHVPNLESAEQIGYFTAPARRLAETFWPGPLTLVVEAKSDCPVCDLARAGLETVAIRIPAHPGAQALLQALGRPLVAPSANRSGKISPTHAKDVADDLGEAVDLILDGGACATGLESTIIDARREKPALLRPGGIASADIDAIWPGLTRPDLNPDAPRAPGQLLRHYAPDAKLRLNALAPEQGEAFLGFGPGPADLNLSPAGDLGEAAANLFSMLRTLDNRYPRIAVAPIPEHGLGEALNDRLSRAAETR